MVPKKRGVAEGDPEGYFEMARTELLNKPRNFLQMMRNYDKDNIPESTVNSARRIINREDFTMEKVKSASQALVRILKWAKAMIVYHDLLKVIKHKLGDTQPAKQLKEEDRTMERPQTSKPPVKSSLRGEAVEENKNMNLE